MPHDSAQLSLNSPQDTCAFAQTLAPCLGAGDVLLLQGDVGAGKTHFARCLIQASLDIPEDVPSPTYTLVQTYPARQAEIWHADLYRLTDLSEVDELGLIDAMTSAICLVEWPDRLGDQAPDSALCLTFDCPHSDDRRVLKLTWSCPGWARRLKGLLDD